jgi:parvulin-like peptidyl-prolyl isomerase
MLPNPPPTPSGPGTRRVRSAHESKSATVRAAAAAPSRRQLSRWQRDQQQQRYLYLAVGALVLVIVAIFAAGLFYDNYIRANATVAQVGPDSITAAQLLDEVRPQAAALDSQAKQYGGTGNQQIADYVDQQKRSLPDQVMNDLIDVHIVQQEAARRNLSVSTSEVDDKERETIAQFQAASNATPTAEPTDAPDASGTPSADQPVLTSATPEPSTLPLGADQTSAGLTPTAVPTLAASDYDAALQKYLSQIGQSEDSLRTQLQRQLLQDKVQAAVGKDQDPDSQQQVHTRQIVVASPDTANDLLTQLKNGADFAQLAQQNSTDTATKDSGGDMGWWPRGVQDKPIEDAAFALQPGGLSDVIQDSGTYHIIQLIENDPSRPVAPSTLDTQRQKAFNDWLTSQRSGQDVKLTLDDSEKNWILSKIGIRP